MSYSKSKIFGVGCDFDSVNDENLRKYAIENLSGGEQERINWMLKNMRSNKSFIYSSKNKNKTVVPDNNIFKDKAALKR